MFIGVLLRTHLLFKDSQEKEKKRRSLGLNCYYSKWKRTMRTRQSCLPFIFPRTDLRNVEDERSVKRSGRSIDGLICSCHGWKQTVSELCSYLHLHSLTNSVICVRKTKFLCSGNFLFHSQSVGNRLGTSTVDYGRTPLSSHWWQNIAKWSIQWRRMKNNLINIYLDWAKARWARTIFPISFHHRKSRK